MKGKELQGSDKWSSFYKAGRGNLHPDENLIRLVRGKYADIPRSGRMIDIGFGRGSNLVFFAQSGYECYGLEVSQDSIEAAKELAALWNVNLNLGLLTGTSLPFNDDFFDIILSWSAVYYYGSRSEVQKAIHEFYRALKPGGVLLMAVIHPNSFMARRLSDDLGDGRHRIDRANPHDNRQGIDIFYDPTSSGWRHLLKEFDEIEEGYVEMDLFSPLRRNAWRLFLARKNKERVVDPCPLVNLHHETGAGIRLRGH